MQTAGVKGSRLSLQQARLWSLQGQSKAYRAQCAVLIKGELDVFVLQQALQQVVNRHEILHTVFYSLPGMQVAMQVIDDARFSYTILDEQSLDVQILTKQIDSLFASAQQEMPNLSQGPLMHAWVLRCSSLEHALLLSLPALCADAYTLKELVNELQQAYALLTSGASFPEEPLQYVDVSAWQDTLFASEDSAIQKAYWQRLDLSPLSQVRLPLFLSAESHWVYEPTSFSPQVVPVILEPEVSQQLHTLAQEQGVELEVVLLACYMTMLWRVGSGCMISVACDGRPYEELTSALGLYTRFVPLHSQLQTHLAFSRLLLILTSELTQARQHQLYFRWPQAQEEPSQLPAMPFSFHYESWPQSWAEDGLHWQHLWHRCWSEPFALHLHALRQGAQLQLELAYDSRQVDVAAVELLAQMLPILLAHVCKKPDATLLSLPLLSPSQHARVLMLGQGQEELQTYPSPVQLFEEQARRYPQQLALVGQGESWSYQQLNEQANQLAHLLRQQGVSPEQVVVLCLSRGPWALLVLLAVLKAGAAYVPLDPEQPQARLAMILDELGAGVLLTERALLSQVKSWSGTCYYLEEVKEQLAEQPITNLEMSIEPEQLAYVLYTSGSTGRPKGVLVRHGGLAHYASAISQELGAQASWRWATVSTLGADLGNTAIFGAWASGGAVHVVPSELLTSPGKLAAHFASQPVEVLKIVPSHLGALLSSSSTREQAQMLLPRRALVLGGEVLPPRLLGELAGLSCPCAVYNHYGPTETTVGTVLKPLRMESWDSKGTKEQGVEVVPLGRPLARTQAYVLDPEGQLLPVGVAGELYLGGNGLARGYLGQPDQTAARFVPHPWSRQGGERLYRTGDRVRWTQEGELEFLGRLDSQVKLRGYRIELEEIEAVLRQHPEVREVVVQLVEQRQEPQLIAYVVGTAGEGVNRQELAGWLAERLPTYMQPGVYEFLPRLPLTANGKIDRQAIAGFQRKEGQSSLPVPAQNSEPQAHIQPRDEIEYRLLHIWEDILSTRPISVLDSFFDLGGHSILAIRLISQIHKHFGQELALATLFQYPTIAELAVILRKQSVLPQSSSALVTLQPEGSAPPFFGVHPAGPHVFCYTNLVRYLGKERPFYALQTPSLAELKEDVNRLEHLAAHYIAAIQTVQPQGPYLLGGWSLGGVIAFEMAQQLQRQGHTIALLAIIDSTAPDPQLTPDRFPERPDLGDAALARNVIEIFKPDVQQADLYQLPPEEQLAYVLDQAKLANTIPADADIAELRRILSLEKMNIYAARTYIPRMYPSLITLFRATESVKSSTDLEHMQDNPNHPDVTRGWEKLAAGGIEVHLIPGSHRELVEEPAVQTLAARLGLCIDKVCGMKRETLS